VFPFLSHSFVNDFWPFLPLPERFGEHPEGVYDPIQAFQADRNREERSHRSRFQGFPGQCKSLFPPVMPPGFLFAIATGSQNSGGNGFGIAV